MSTTATKPGLLEDGFIDVARACEFIGLSRAKLYQLMEAGELAYCKIGKARRIPRRSLIELAERNMVGAK